MHHACGKFYMLVIYSIFHMSGAVYRKVSLPKELVDRAENLVADKELALGYLTVTDLIREAIRKHLTTLELKRTHLKVKADRGTQ